MAKANVPKRGELSSGILSNNHRSQRSLLVEARELNRKRSKTRGHGLLLTGASRHRRPSNTSCQQPRCCRNCCGRDGSDDHGRSFTSSSVAVRARPRDVYTIMDISNLYNDERRNKGRTLWLPRRVCRIWHTELLSHPKSSGRIRGLVWFPNHPARPPSLPHPLTRPT